MGIDAVLEARAVYVAPSHHYPTEETLDGTRRAALTDYARSPDSIVGEDDYDSEFRCDVAARPARAQVDTDHVVCLGTIMTTLGAGIRLGWMVPPLERRAAVLICRRATTDFPSTRVYEAVQSLIEGG